MRTHFHVHPNSRQDEAVFREASENFGRSSSGEKHGHTVWAVEAWYFGESPRAKLHRVSSEERRTPFRGQAVHQSTEVRSVLDFFATAQSFCGRSLQSVQLNGAHSSHSSCWPWRPTRVRTLLDKAESLLASCGECSRSKLQRVTPEDLRTPVLG